MGLLHLGGLRKPKQTPGKRNEDGGHTVDGSFEIQLHDQLRLVVYLSHDFSRVSCQVVIAGFLNHQQYDGSMGPGIFT